jgi:hypothetical protein
VRLPLVPVPAPVVPVSVACAWDLDQLVAELLKLAAFEVSAGYPRRLLYCHRTVYAALSITVVGSALPLPPPQGCAALLPGLDVITGKGDPPGGWRLASADRKSILWHGILPLVPA